MPCALRRSESGDGLKRCMERRPEADDLDAALKASAERALTWLFDEVLPLWCTRGRAPVGWHDRLGRDFEPMAVPLRLRVQARQMYVFAEAGRLGWGGPWREAVEHGLDFLIDHGLRTDGLAAQTFGADGRTIQSGPDLYDQSFALFGFAAAFGATRDGRALAAGRRLHEALNASAHPSGGYREFDGPLLRANPHMHMLEAALRWAACDDDPRWIDLARSLTRLCVDRLVDHRTDALREVFVGDWRPAPAPPGDSTEPGHHFEWAWLLNHAELDAPADVPLRLCERAERVGVDPARGVAMNAVAVDGAVLDADARLWPQTERLKAALAMRPHDRALWTGRAMAATETLFAYTEGMPAGLWLDVMAPDGALRDEAAPASSLYHITCAVSELAQAAGLVEPRW